MAFLYSLQKTATWRDLRDAFRREDPELHHRRVVEPLALLDHGPEAAPRASF